MSRKKLLRLLSAVSVRHLNKTPNTRESKMKRRNFMTFLSISAITKVAFPGCSNTGSSKNIRHIVATPQKRAEYLALMLKRLCTDLGPHPSGSPEYDEAAKIILEEMKPALPYAELDKYFCETWELLGEPKFIVGGKSLETYPAHGCTETPQGGVNGFLKRLDISGIPYGVVDKSTDDLGAYVTVSSHGRAVPMYAGRRDIRKLPIFNIGKQDVSLLETAVENRTPVYIDVHIRYISGTPSSNIVGTLYGRSSDEILVLAHADTVYSSPGANDNTASMITMLMLAHAFSGTTPDLTITFIATGTEEYGFLGARHYAKKRESEGTLKNIKFIINFDSLTYGPNLWIYSIDKKIQSILKAIHEELNINGTPEFFDSSGFKLDAMPFSKSGARAVYINSRGYDEKTLHLWHRPEDLPETVHVDCVENSFLVFREFISRIQKL